MTDETTVQVGAERDPDAEAKRFMAASQRNYMTQAGDPAYDAQAAAKSFVGTSRCVTPTDHD